MNDAEKAHQIYQLMFFRRTLEGCPPPAQTADGLMGWKGGELSPVCVKCTSRLAGRGIDTKTLTENPIWTDGRTANYGACQLCDVIMTDPRTTPETKQ